MKVTVDALEKERDFYFGKLRDIEVMCQEHEASNVPAVQQIIEILYATEVCDKHFHLSHTELLFLLDDMFVVQCLTCVPLQMLPNGGCHEL